MPAMFRMALCRPVLLSALVCLLSWVAICNASPMDATSSTPSTKAALGIPFDNPEERAYIQNLPHYNGLPMFNQLTESQEIIDLARRQNGAAYIYRNPVHLNERFSPYIYVQGQRATRAPRRDIQELQSKLQAARTDGQQFGNAVRWLKHGRPFQKTDTSPYSWDEVWARSLVLHAPTSQDSVDWFAIRNILQGQRRVVLKDTARQKALAFRLDAFGHVELDVKDLARFLHKRSYTPSNDVPPGHILKTNPNVAKELLKRGQPFKPGSSSNPILGTMDLVLVYEGGLTRRPDLTPTPGGVEGLNVRYGHILHFEGRPVLDASRFSVEQLEQATVDYDYIYVYGHKTGESRYSVAKVFRNRAPIYPVRNSEQLLGLIAQWKRDGDRFEPAIRELLHGRPIRRDRWNLHPLKTMHTGPGHAPLTLPELRTALENAVSLHIHEPNGNVLKFFLDEHGIAKMVDGLGSAHFKRSIDKRMNQPIPSDVGRNPFNEDARVSNQRSNGANHLFKRGIPFEGGPSASQSHTMEYVLGFPEGFRIQHDLTPTSGGIAGLDRKWASILHFRGYPVFNVHTTPTGDLEQAVVDYDYIYVYGTKRGQRQRSIVQLFRSRAPVDPAPNSGLLRQVIEQSRLYEISNGRLSRALIDGRPIQRIAGAPADEHVFFNGEGRTTLDLHAMRAALATSGSVKVVDLDTGDTAHWTLNDRNLGSVVVDVVSHQHPLVKRTNQPGSSDIDHNSQLFNENAQARPKLVKRMEVDQPGRTGRPLSIEMVRQGFRYQAPRERLTQENRKRLFATDVHYDGVPILSVDPYPNPLSRGKLQHALDHYQSTWLTWTPADNPTMLATRVHQDGRFHAANMQRVLNGLGIANEFGARYGDNAKFLRFGLPFSRRQDRSFFRKYKTPSWQKVRASPVEFDLAVEDPVVLHNHLDENNLLKAQDSRTGAKYGFALDREGEVLFKIFSEGTHHLVKRAWEPKHLEYYSHLGFSEPNPPLSAQTVEDRSKMFADLLHYEGQPIFFPAEDDSTPARASQAVADHHGFWIVGNYVHDPHTPVALHFRRGGQIFPGGEEKALQHIMNANRFEITYGRAAKLLKYGPGFPPRPSSRFGRHKTPGWKKVLQKAEQVPHTTPMSEIWEKLHQKNMLVVTEGTKQLGFALDREGNVLHHVFAGL
ncbi:uncharacterized protein UTRI_10479_B [Ustilago trichophora]|uniref:Uncharacterized protein n=1 Tax=Ustilago trichophora TaxID=86804 RepID=A0A5C3EBM4_9BASI|nr:uncharacterized protein UTRI_10479_B [Ustilago trichophora]